MPSISKKIPSLTLADLWRGMKAYICYYPRGSWPLDFHAAFYGELHAEMKTDGFSKEWWKKRVDNLAAWKALRSSTPTSKGYIIKECMKQSGDLEREYRNIIRYDKNANIVSCKWNVAAGLFKVAMKIKPTKGGSPVFASKLCHFILPELFPILDTTALPFQNPTAKDYEEYWKCCRVRWRDCDCKEDLKGLLRSVIQAEGGNVTHYPWATRIPEICSMQPPKK